MKVISVKFPIHLPSGVADSRERFGFTKDRTLFVTSFEPHSDMERKNSVAVIDAFRRAFTDGTQADLLIKVNNPTQGGVVHPGVRVLRQRCGEDPRTPLIDEPLRYRDVLALYASCDVFVSLHRSEGRGLGLMEPMALGKPVIATGWCGNKRFMNQSNSCLVGYDLNPVPGHLPVYPRRNSRQICPAGVSKGRGRGGLDEAPGPGPESEVGDRQEGLGFHRAAAGRGCPPWFSR